MITKINAKTIDIEGADCVGKETNARFVAEKLKAFYVDFPRYHTPMAYPINRWLNREYDTSLMSYTYISSLYYADMIDFQASSRHTHNFDDPNQFIVFDRWIYSNLIYQSMYGINEINDRNKSTILERMSKIFELALDMGLIVPDHTIILAGSTTKYLEAKQNKDKNETKEFQLKVHKNLNNFIEWMDAIYDYHPACKGKTYDVINVCDASGNFDSIENNKAKVLNSVKMAFGGI
jgi:thymidylate kinase